MVVVASLAAALLLAPRAMRVPAVSAPPEPLDDIVLEAALAAIPPGLLAALALSGATLRRSPSAGRAGAAKLGNARGRPTGVRRGEPQGGARLNLVETLRAAAPWQAVRRREAAAARTTGTARIQVRREDFHVWRFKQRSETTTVFVVDASGSAALHRLAETKGAVELLLADCYVRRDAGRGAAHRRPCQHRARRHAGPRTRRRRRARGRAADAHRRLCGAAARHLAASARQRSRTRRGDGRALPAAAVRRCGRALAGGARGRSRAGMCSKWAKPERGRSHC